MRFTVIIVLSVIVLAGLILLIWGLIEASCLNVTKDRLILSKNSSDSGPDLRILYFSDLHKEFCLVPVKRVLAVIREQHEGQKLDAVIFGGDLSNTPRNASKALPYIKAISELCKELQIPFMAVTGNHDAKVDAEVLGAFPFDNMDGCIKYLKSRRSGSLIAFGGVPDTGRHERVWGIPPAPSGKIEYDAYVLLSHNPDIVLHMPPELPFKVDAMISGHIHGGQIRTPFGLEFVLRHDELPFKGIISGLNEVNGIKIFISKGIGCVFLPLRIGARPEINILEICC